MPPLLAIRVLYSGRVCAHVFTRAGRGHVGFVSDDEGRASVSSISEVRPWMVAWNCLPLSVLLWPQPCRHQVSFLAARTLQGCWGPCLGVPVCPLWGIEIKRCPCLGAPCVGNYRPVLSWGASRVPVSQTSQLPPRPPCCDVAHPGLQSSLALPDGGNLSLPCPAPGARTPLFLCGVLCPLLLPLIPSRLC